MALDMYRKQRRGGRGVITIRTTSRNGKVVRVAQVVQADEVMLITDGGKVLRCPVRGISKMGRATQGVRVMNLGAGESLVSMARLAEVDPKRIGVTGHSFGGKWAMFAACLYEKFACAAVSDPGIVFDEKRGNVNYWDPWYLGYEAGRTRKRGLPSKANPAIGSYKRLVAGGRD